jgi:geranylgeranyl diphosphate synthase type II
MKLDEYMFQKVIIIEDELERLLPDEEIPPSTLHESMRYTTFLGGKRIRPVMMLAIGEIFKAEPAPIITGAAAIEMLHSSSLILDDLPCMDDATLRRGQKTNHLIFGEDIAILAGFGLMNLAFKAVNDLHKEQNIPLKRILEVSQQLNYAIGTEGLIGGQTMDLEGEGKTLTFKDLEFIHSRKTGALFNAAGQIACILSGASDKDRTAIELYTKNLGLAFQVVDDVLDVTADEKVLGKDADKDADKTTFVSFSSIDEAKKVAEELVEFSIEAVQRYGKKADILIQLANFVKDREM